MGTPRRIEVLGCVAVPTEHPEPRGEPMLDKPDINPMSPARMRIRGRSHLSAVLRPPAVDMIDAQEYQFADPTTRTGSAVVIDHELASVQNAGAGSLPIFFDVVLVVLLGCRQAVVPLSDVAQPVLTGLAGQVLGTPLTRTRSFSWHKGSLS